MLDACGRFFFKFPSFPILAHTSMKNVSIAIIGGGFSGTLAAIHLSRQLPQAAIVLLEASPQAGRGLAYQESDACRLLNVPAGEMSAFVDAPDDFAWFATKILQRSVSRDEFLSRPLYGAYLQELLAQALKDSPHLSVRQAEVTDIISDGPGATLVLRDGSRLTADHVVLATGNQDSAFSQSIWAPHTKPVRDTQSFDDLAEDAPVVIIGSGLSMIDAISELEKRGHHGPIHVTSRHGLLPQVYAPASDVPPPPIESLPEDNLRQSVRWFRKAIAAHQAAGGDWRDLFTALRTSTPALWHELSPRDRQRFLRFFSPFWETHRHQCAPRTRAHLDGLIAEKRLHLHRGTLVSVVKNADGWAVELAPRANGQSNRRIQAARIFDATGPARDLQSIRQPLIRNLARRGFLTADLHRLGARTHSDYRALQRDGSPSPWLYVVGPMLRARFYEATAVPELRLHTAALAARIRQAVASVSHPAAQLTSV